MSSAKSQVAVATNIPNISATQTQKEYSTEDSLGRQNSFGNQRRGNMKGKHLTRSHAMRESTSPPRTPTPRAEHGQISPNGQSTSNYQQHHQQHHDANDSSHSSNSSSSSSSSSSNNNANTNNNNNNNHSNKLHAQSAGGRGNSPIIEAPAVIVTSQHSQLQQQHQPQSNVALTNEAEFPKLTPPKSTKATSGGGGQRNNNGVADSNSNKIEYNNNGGKKSSSDLKPSTASCAAESVKTGSPNNINKQQQYNVTSGEGTSPRSGSGSVHLSHQTQSPPPSQQTTTNSTAVVSLHNSGMNYQLNAGDGSNHHQQQHPVMYDKENRCPRNDSQNSNISNMHDDEAQPHYDRSSGGSSVGGGGGGGKKHRTNSNSKGNKPRLKNIGGSSSGSVDGGNPSSNNTSGFISRENSGDQFTDHGGTDLVSFFRETLNKHPKDRHILLKIEKDLIELVQDKSRAEMRFPSASSYNRMLIHRTAAFFGMEHNVDTETQQCVIVAPTKNTRIPDIRFKSLVRDHRDDSRKSILKRDTHSFDEARQSSYLCPDRGSMLDRKAKSFEEREEDYERARSRIFNRSQNESGDGLDDNYINVSWTQSVEQQQQQQQRSRPNGKMMKMQNSIDSRDGRSSGGAVPKAHNFSNYGAPPQSSGSSMLRGDSISSNKNSSGGGGRVFAKQDSAGSTNTAWRLSPSSSGYKTQTQSVHSDSVTPSPNGYCSEEHTPEPPALTSQPPAHLHLQLPTLASASIAAGSLDSAVEDGAAVEPPTCGLVWAVTDISSVPKGSVLINPQTLQPIVNQDGSIYHFDPSNLPLNQTISSGAYQNQTQNNASPNTTTTYAQPPQQHSPPQSQSQSQSQQLNPKKNKLHPIPPPLPLHHSQSRSASNDGSSTTLSNHVDTVSESSTQTINMCTDATCDANTNCVVSESSSTEEVSTQLSADECDNTANATCCLSITTSTSTKNYDRIEVQKFKNQATSPNIPTDKEDVPKRENSTSSDASNSHDPPSRNHPPSSQTPTNSVGIPLHRETPHSARSTPFSNSESTTTKRASEEPKPTTWTYTQSYQAPDGSTVFHTTTTPSGTPYCTTYQQGPDGSIYAIPQGMIYTYPPPVDGEVQGYFMPVFDQSRADATSLIPAGTPAIYPAAGGTTTMVPMAAAYPTPQFATANGAPIYPGQVIYSSEQFTPGSAAVAAAAPANGQLQQIPLTYPIGYPYPYNSYWSQPMTYYVPQQALTNAVTATPLLPAPPPPPAATASAVAGPHVTGGVNITNGLIAAPAAAGPPSNTTATVLSSATGNNATSGGTLAGSSASMATNSYQSHSGTTYYGTGRVKRPTPSHYTSHQSGAHQLVAAIPSNANATTTYQLGHAVPTLALGPAHGTTAAAATTTDLSAGGATAPATAMYTLPQHAALFSANIFPYAHAPTPTAGVATGAHQPHTPQATALAAPPTANPTVASGVGVGVGAAAHAQQSNAVITPFYAHHPPMAAHSAHGATVHAPGPSAIPIVDPTTLTTVSQTPTGGGTTGNQISSYSTGGAGNNNNTSQSAPSTPHSLPSQTQRNPPLFSTPPINSGIGGNNNGSYSTSSTPHYYNSSDQQHSHVSNNSPHSGSYVSHDKRNTNSTVGGKKPPAYGGGSMNRQNSSSTSYNGPTGGKPPLLSSNNDTRASPNNGSNYQGARPHVMNKRGGSEKPQTPLLSGPPTYNSGASAAVISNSNHSYHAHHSSTTTDAKPPIRLNAAAASFRQKGSGGGGGIEFRRSVSQRNSPGTGNSSSNDNSNNTSPNSIVGSNGGNTPNCYVPSGSYISNSGGGNGEHLATGNAGTQLYLTARGAHIPPQLQHGGMMAASAAAGGSAAGIAGSQQATTAAVLGGAASAAAAAEVANAAAAAVAATVAHHQPLLSAYQPGASGVYIKYGQPFYAHPSVALPNSRRSPSTELRPAMAPMTGMYSTVNMMIPAAPRHAQGRHPNPNYKGTRPR